MGGGGRPSEGEVFGVPLLLHPLRPAATSALKVGPPLKTRHSGARSEPGRRGGRGYLVQNNQSPQHDHATTTYKKCEGAHYFQHFFISGGSMVMMGGFGYFGFAP